MAKKLFLCNLDLNGNQLSNVALEALSAAPSTLLVSGRVYFDTEDNAIKIFDGTNWNVLLKTGDVVNAVTAGSSSPVSSGAVAAAIAGLTGAMHFIAVLDSQTYDTFSGALAAYKESHTSYVEASGDVMIYGIKEYVYDGTQWCELGDETIVVTSFGGQTGAITVRGSQSATGSVNLSMSGGELQATLVMPIASDILMTGYSKAVAEAAIAESDSVAAAIGKLEYKIDALKTTVLEDEETTAQALNDLNDRIDSIESAEVKKYVTTVTSDDGSHSATIAAVTHGCGTDPLVSVFYDGSQVIIDQAIDASGNVTISWAAATVISAEHPLKVVMMG